MPNPKYHRRSDITNISYTCAVEASKHNWCSLSPSTRTFEHCSWRTLNVGRNAWTQRGRRGVGDDRHSGYVSYKRPVPCPRTIPPPRHGNAYGSTGTVAGISMTMTTAEPCIHPLSCPSHHVQQRTRRYNSLDPCSSHPCLCMLYCLLRYDGASFSQGRTGLFVRRLKKI